MIQRIQSIYLLLATLLTGSLLFLDLANIFGSAGDFVLRFYGIITIVNNETEVIVPLIAMAFLLITTVFSLFVSVFLYRKRILQIRLSGINMGLLTGIVGMIIYLVIQASKKWEMDYSFTFSIVFPVIALILVYLAIRAIGKDEALVRSLDRIR